MIEFIMSNIWIISFYIYMGICTAIANKAVSKIDISFFWSLVTVIIWPIPLTLSLLVKILEE